VIISKPAKIECT